MIDIEEIVQELTNVYSDPTRIYLIEKYMSTFNASAGKLTPFVLFPRQKEFLKSLAYNKATIAIKHRQAGITTVTSAWAAAQMACSQSDSPETVLCIGNKLDLSQQLITKIRDFLLQIPRWYWGDEYYSEDPSSDKNKKDIFVKNSKSELELFNGSKVYARSSGANAARGISAVSILIFDEAAFIEDGKAVYSSAVAATASVPKSKIIMVSTPNGKDDLYYKTYQLALAKENNYNAVEFKWFQDLRYNKFLYWTKKDEKSGKIIKKEEEIIGEDGSVRYDEEKWRNMETEGWIPNSPWYSEMCLQFNNDPIKIAQELDVSFQGSANNVVGSEYIDMHRTLNQRDALNDMKDPYVDETWFFKKPIEGHRYICSCDPSRGTSEDNTAIEIIDVDGKDENGMPIVEQCMEYLGKKLGDEVGRMLYRYASMYNNAFVVVDATGGQGDAAILQLMNLGYKNLYYDDLVQKTYMDQSQEFQKGVNTLPGFHFQGNRFPVLSNFAGMVRGNDFKIRSVRTISELETWIFKGDQGRMDHMSGSHDDTITCLAMGLFVMQYSFNRIESEKSKDEAMLNAYFSSSSLSSSENYGQNASLSFHPDSYFPIYSSNMTNKSSFEGESGNYLWLYSIKK